MEQWRNEEREEGKSKQQKKKSLCRLLLNKKTRVGCLDPNRPDGDSNGNLQRDDSQHSSQVSTKLSLCCAMTARNRTPRTPRSVSASTIGPAVPPLPTSNQQSIEKLNDDNAAVMRRNDSRTLYNGGIDRCFW